MIDIVRVFSGKNKWIYAISISLMTSVLFIVNALEFLEKIIKSLLLFVFSAILFLAIFWRVVEYLVKENGKNNK